MSINATLIGQAISFFFFVLFCMKFVWPPIMAALEERKTKIADSLAAAERGQHEKELAEKHAKDVMGKTKQEAAEIIAQAHRRGDEIVDEAKTDARGEGDRLLTAAKAEIEQERTRAREELRGEVAALAIAGAEQILMREVDINAHNEVLDKLAADL